MTQNGLAIPSNPHWATQCIKSVSDALHDHLIDGLERAIQCANWLKAQGFTVRHVQAGRRNPRVVIDACRLCLKLDGVVYITERRYNHPIKRSWIAHRFGCEVRWEESEAQH